MTIHRAHQLLSFPTTWRSSRKTAVLLVLSVALLNAHPAVAAEPKVQEGASVSETSEPEGRPPISRGMRGFRPSRGIFGAEGSDSSGWWMGTAGIALVLAVGGGLSLAARKYLPQRPSTLLQVVGRVSLSPRQSIFLVRTGGRVLLVGTGPQGAPSYLGELVDSDHDIPEFFAPQELAPSTPPSRIPVTTSGSRFDVRLGEQA